MQLETEVLIILPFMSGAVTFAKPREGIIKPNLLQILIKIIQGSRDF